MTDADKQYAYWLATRGCGIKRAARIKRAPSRANSKRSGSVNRKERAKKFKWAFLTSGTTPPLKHKFGIP